MRTVISSMLLSLIGVALADAQPDTISTYAGGGPLGGPALSMNVAPQGVAATATGEVYFTNASTVYKMSGDVALLIAGIPGISGFSGDNGPATSASLNYLSRVAAEGHGNVYIADSGNNRVRRVTAETGVITTVAGNGNYGYSGDGGPATSASLSGVNGVAVDGSGNLYIGDSGNRRVRRVTAETGVITTVAGNGSYGYTGDGGLATSASLSGVNGVAIDGSGNLYIADTGNGRIRKVSADTGVITTVAGNGTSGYTGDGGPATSASLNYPADVAVDGSGNLYIAERNRIRKVSAGTGVITTVAGNGSCCDSSGDGGPATSASLNYPGRTAVNGNGDVYIAERNRIRKVSADTSMITTVAGNGSCCDSSGDGGPAASASLSPSGVAVDGGGNLYIAERSRIRKVSADTGLITTVAGNGTCCYRGDGGPATSASLSNASGVAVDGSGNFYIVDSNRIRKVSADTGVISTVAGNESYGYSGDGGPATRASLNNPGGVAVDGSGNLYIADTDNNRIRKVSAETGVITTVAGNDTYGFSGEGGPATSASLNNPGGAAVDDRGNLYIADSRNQRIREVFAKTGVIATVAGNGSYGFRGDNGSGLSARLANPSGVAVDSSGNFYFVDSGNNRIRKVDHRISTTTLVTSNANPTATQNLVLTAAISPSDATGSVQFFDGSTALRSVTLPGGTVTLSDLSLTVGTHAFIAVYSGDTNHAMSTSPAVVQVVSSQPISTVTLSSDAQPTQSDGQTVYVSMLNSPATFTATITPAEASGSVQFFDGATSLGAQALSAGTAVFTTSSLPAGTHTITALYSDDVLFMPSWAAPLTQQVQETVSANNVKISLRFALTGKR